MSQVYDHTVQSGQRSQNSDLEKQFLSGTKTPPPAPLQTQGYRDVACIFIFVIMWVLMIILGFVGLGTGDISLVYSPFDMYQNQCGKGDAAEYQNVYMINPYTFYCVKECPGKINDIVEAYNSTSFSAPYGSRDDITFCYPIDIFARAIIGDSFNIAFIQKVFADISVTWPLILGTTFFSLFLSVGLVFAIRWKAIFIIWGIITLYELIITILGFLFYLVSQSDPESGVESAMILCFLLAAISLLVILCKCKKINEAAKILKTSADFTREKWNVIFVPFIALFLINSYLVFSIYFACLIYSTSSESHKPIAIQPYIEFGWDNKTGWQLCIYIFGLVWSICFVIGLCQFTISSLCCIWFYRKQNFPGEASMKTVFRNALTKSLGSILLGSFILAAVWIIYKSLEEIKEQIEKDGCCKCIIRCCCCCCLDFLIKIFEEFIEFLTSSAFVMVCLTGEGFFRAAHIAYELDDRHNDTINIENHQKAVETAGTIGSLFLGVASFFFALVIFVTSGYSEVVAPDNYSILYTGIIGYVIGKLFMHIYVMSVNSIAICYKIQLDTQSQIGQVYVPDALATYLREAQNKEGTNK